MARTRPRLTQDDPFCYRALNILEGIMQIQRQRHRLRVEVDDGTLARLRRAAEINRRTVLQEGGFALTEYYRRLAADGVFDGDVRRRPV